MGFFRRLLGVGRTRQAAADFIDRASRGLARDNFEYIAVNTATIWAILCESYPSRLPTEKAKLAACAYLVLYAYLEQGRLGPADLELAMLCASQGECMAGAISKAHESRSMEMILFGSEMERPNLYEPRVLLNLTMQLEVQAFDADNTEMLPEDLIIDSVVDKKKVIAQVLTDTERAIHNGDFPLVGKVREWLADKLDSSQFETTMNQLGITVVHGV
jgi:hypothetical protein